MTAFLEVDGVSKTFGGVAANQDVSFTVAEGEILGLIGPNGAGKTSLFNSISGEVSPDAGEIRLDRCAYARAVRLQRPPDAFLFS